MRAIVACCVVFVCVTGNASSADNLADVSVADLGARCNGSADDTSALQRALDARASRVVRLPPGRCRITGMLTLSTDGLRIIGAGAGVTSLVADFEHNAENPASVLVTPKDPKTGFISNSGFEGISLVQGERFRGGIGLEVVMANGFHWRDGEILGHGIGAEIVGGYNVFADDIHINTMPNSGEAGTRDVQLSAQRRADGSWFPPQGVHISNFNWSGDASAEYGLEVRAGDGVYLANGYIGEAKRCEMRVSADPLEKFVSTVNLTGVYLDGNFKSSCGAEIGKHAVDIKFSGATIANFADDCLEIADNSILAVTVSGGVLMRCKAAIAMRGGEGLVLNGASLFSTGPIRIGNHVRGPIAISGNAFVRPTGNDSPIVIEDDGDHSPLPAVVSVFGNAFARPGPPVRAEAPAPHLVVTPAP